MANKIIAWNYEVSSALTHWTAAIDCCPAVGMRILYNYKSLKEKKCIKSKQEKIFIVEMLSLRKKKFDICN